MYWDRISRRHFLQGLGGFTFALPFLPSLLTKAQAAGGVGKRFIALHSGHCQAVEQWLPGINTNQMTASGSYARSMSLASIAAANQYNEISPILGSALNDVRSKLTLISRLDPLSSSPNHNAEVILTSGVKGQAKTSLDHFLAQKLFNSSPTNLYIRSVGDQYYDGQSHMSLKNGNYVLGNFNPSGVFQTLFGSGTGGPTPGGPSASSLVDVNTADKVLQDYKALLKNPKLSSEDIQKLTQHMELVNQLHTKLKSSLVPTTNTGTLQCNSSHPNAPKNSPTKSDNIADYQVVMDQMFDLLWLGVMCGHIKVATLMLHVYEGFGSYVNFINIAGIGTRFARIGANQRLHEDLGHCLQQGQRPMRLTLNRWFAERIARFLKNLDSIVEDPSTGRTYLDNSIILWGNDQGIQANCDRHQSNNMPILLAGSAGGYLKTGMYVDYGPALNGSVRVGGETNEYRRGFPLNTLLVTILQAMGLQPSDYESGGQPGWGYSDSGIANNYNHLGNARFQSLPIITA